MSVFGLSSLKYLFFFISLNAFASSDLFNEYMGAVNRGEVSKANVGEWLRQSEGNFYTEVSEKFEAMKFSYDQDDVIRINRRFQDRGRDWLSHAGKLELRTMLAEISKDGSLAHTSTKIKSGLKKNRKYAHLIRETFNVFDVDHSTPKDLEKFVKSFGGLNDAIVVEDKELIEKRARKVLKAFEALEFSTLDKRFQAVDRTQFMEFVSATKADTLAIADKDSHTPHDFMISENPTKSF